MKHGCAYAKDNLHMHSTKLAAMGDNGRIAARYIIHKGAEPETEQAACYCAVRGEQGIGDAADMQSPVALCRWRQGQKSPLHH